MKIAILSRNRQLFSIQRLLREAKTLKLPVEVVDPLDCQILVAKHRNTMFLHDKPFPDVDIVIPRIGTSITEYGLAVVRQFEAMGVKVLNSSRGIADSRDKLKCSQILAQRGFDVPVTMLMRGGKSCRFAIHKVHGTPVVMKLIEGTQGVGVMLLESAASAESVLDTMWGLNQDVIIQQYIAESAGRDIRALVIGDQVVAAMRRQAREGEFRSNIHRGGEGVPIELKDAYKRIAVQAAKAVGLSIAGVDMLESLSGPKVIEVNSSPGFEGIEEATGLNIARLILQHASNVARGRKSRLKPVKLTRRSSVTRRVTTSRRSGPSKRG